MKKEISTPTLVAIVAAVVLLLGFVGWKVVNPSGGNVKVDAKSASIRKEQKEEK